MLIQVLEEYINRTEYRLLNNFCIFEIVSINTLKKGSLVLPGIVLNKFSDADKNKLNLWLESSSNQLILLPAWNEINLKKYFNTSLDFNITKTESFYNKIPVNYSIEASIKDRIFIEGGKIFGVNYKNNLSSGLITVVTLPLLDYRFIDFEEEFKAIFISLVQKKDDLIEQEKFSDELCIDGIHVFIIIMSAASINLNTKLDIKVLKYFGVKHDEKILKEKYNELLKDRYIENGVLIDKGISFVNKKGLKAFIDVLKERRENEDGWN